MEAAGISAAVALEHHDDHDHHGPPEANRSSRVDPELLGMLLFIISEIMVFGAFFTAYFFIRFVADGPPLVPVRRQRAAGRRRRRQHRDPAELVADDALGADVDQERQPLRPQGRHAADRRCSALTFLSIQINEYVHIGFSPQNHAQGTIFYGLTGLHGAHVFIGLSLLVMVTVRAFRGHFSPEHHHGVEVPGHLLALRRRHVGRRVHDDLHPLGAPGRVSRRAAPAAPGSPRRPRSRSCCACSRSASPLALLATLLKAIF